MNKLIKPIWIFILISLWIINLVMFTVAPEYVIFNQAVLGSAIGLSLLFLVIYRKVIIQGLKKPYQRHVMTNSITIILVTLIIILINHLSLEVRMAKDFTKDKLHTLSQQSQHLINNLKAPLKLELFAKRSDWDRYYSLLRQYESESKKITVKLHDIETSPTLVQQKGIKENGTLLLSFMGRELIAPIKNELDITNLILKAQKEKRLKIYYTIGHKEIDRNVSGNLGAKYFYDKVFQSNYILKPIDLLKQSSIPMEADLLMILAPRTGFLEKEINSLKQYLERGGNVLALLPPMFFDEDLTTLLELIKSYGVEVENKLALDRLSTMQGADASMPIITNFDLSHPISKGFSSRVLFPISSSLKENKAENIKTTVIAKTTAFPGSWAESDLKNINTGKVFFNGDQDTKGPINLMIASVHAKFNSKLVIGSSVQMISNAYKSQSPNFNLMLNSIAWLTDDEGIISLNRPGLNEEVIIMSASELSLIFYFSILFLPFVFFALGIWMYRHRVNR